MVCRTMPDGIRWRDVEAAVMTPKERSDMIRVLLHEMCDAYDHTYCAPGCTDRHSAVDSADPACMRSALEVVLNHLDAMVSPLGGVVH